MVASGGISAVTASDAVEPRRGGRPRSTEADAAILAATIDVFAEVGFDGLSVEGVAARAGVGKTTIYRRYPCKVDLVMAAAVHMSEQSVPPVDTGHLDGDLRLVVRHLVRMLTTTDTGRTLPAFLAANQRHPQLAAAYRELIARRRARTMDIIRRGIERGELRAGTDPEVVADMIAAPIFYRGFITGRALDDAFCDAVVDAALRAFAAD